MSHLTIKAELNTNEKPAHKTSLLVSSTEFLKNSKRERTDSDSDEGVDQMTGKTGETIDSNNVHIAKIIMHVLPEVPPLLQTMELLVMFLTLIHNAANNLIDLAVLKPWSEADRCFLAQGPLPLPSSTNIYRILQLETIGAVTRPPDRE